MIMISFRTRRDKDDMIHKAKQMKEFATEFVECLEDGEYEDDERYDERSRYSMRDDEHMHDGMRMRSRYSYK